jgi:isopenicillin-N N-acyltransferase-like protein
MMLSPAVVYTLRGTPADRGRGQAALPGIDPADVRAVIETRFEAARPVIETGPARYYLARQMDFARRHAEPEMAEFDGVAAGFGVDPDRLFALLNLSILAGAYETDGCTAWARPLSGGGAVLVKNRDLSGPHRNFQALFLHDDPGAPGGAILNVGTIGAPGVYSSGINAAGLALADTAIAAPVHRVGWLRYLLMTRILATCRSVAEACDLVGSVRHAGGGSLILADATGSVAAVELLADRPRIDPSPPAFRTNHFRAEPIEATAARISAEALASTTGRHANLERRLAAGLGTSGIGPIAAAMADHGPGGFCRHGEGDGAHTVSTAIYSTGDLKLRFARGNPCESAWEETTIGEKGEGAPP